MSLTLYSHPMMVESAARYGSASNNHPATATRLISATISRPNTNNSASVIYNAVHNDGRMTSPIHTRTCSLPEIPNSPSQRSIASSDVPLLLQSRKVAEKQCDEETSCQHRNSIFPNFRALQKLSLSAKSRALGLTESTVTSPAVLTIGRRQPITCKPTQSSENEYSRHCDNKLRRHKSVDDTQVPAGFNSTLPGNRHIDTECHNARSEEMIDVCVADHSVSLKHRKKKSTKKKKRQSRAKSRSQSSHKYAHETKQSSGSRAVKDRRGPPLDNSLGSLLLAVPVIVESKKIEIYSSRYSKSDTENNNEQKDYNMKLNSLKKASLDTIATHCQGTVEHDPVMCGSKISPRIPGVGGLNANHHGARDDISRVTKVFLSEKQSGNLRELGCILPCAPPGTPTPQMLQKYQYIPSMTDLRSQRTVRDRLSSMEEKVKRKVQQRREEARKTEQQLQRDQAIALKQRQRLEIYALNKIMTEFEWKNFQGFMKKTEMKTP